MTMIDKLIAWFEQQIGTTENPPNSNSIRYNNWFYNRDVREKYCVVGIACGFHECGLDELWLNGNTKETAYCPYVVSTAKKLGQWVQDDEIQRGDVVLFDWGNDSIADHVGFCIANNGDGTITTIEFNTSPTNAGSQSNGGGVYKRSRQLRDVMGGYRPKYEEEEMRYNYIDENTAAIAPDCNECLNHLVKEGHLTGKDDGKGNVIYDLSYDMIRTFLVFYRAGAI